MVFLLINPVANNKSAKKRIKIAERNRLVNKSYKSTVKTLTKKTLENCEKYKKDPNEDNKNLVKASLNRAFSLIDKAVKKNILHKNNGANKKSKINQFVKTTLTAK
jgi:small subunit ribosomal protein S20